MPKNSETLVNPNCAEPSEKRPLISPPEPARARDKNGQYEVCKIRPPLVQNRHDVPSCVACGYRLHHKVQVKCRTNHCKAAIHKVCARLLTVSEDFCCSKIGDRIVKLKDQKRTIYDFSGYPKPTVKPGNTGEVFSVPNHPRKTKNRIDKLPENITAVATANQFQALADFCSENDAPDVCENDLSESSNSQGDLFDDDPGGFTLTDVEQDDFSTFVTDCRLVLTPTTARNSVARTLTRDFELDQESHADSPVDHANAEPMQKSPEGQTVRKNFEHLNAQKILEYARTRLSPPPNLTPADDTEEIVDSVALEKKCDYCERYVNAALKDHWLNCPALVVTPGSPQRMRNKKLIKMSKKVKINSRLGKIIVPTATPRLSTPKKRHRDTTALLESRSLSYSPTQNNSKKVRTVADPIESSRREVIIDMDFNITTLELPTKDDLEISFSEVNANLPFVENSEPSTSGESYNVDMIDQISRVSTSVFSEPNPSRPPKITAFECFFVAILLVFIMVMIRLNDIRWVSDTMD